MKTRWLRLMLATGLVLSLFAGVIGSAGAFHSTPGNVTIDNPGFESGAHAYFPWVPNDVEDLDGLGPFSGTVTIQNLTHLEQETEVDLYVGTNGGDDYWELAQTISLSANESQTLSADSLDIPEGEGAPVVAVGWFERGSICADYVPTDDHDNDDVDDNCDYNSEIGDWDNPEDEVESAAYGTIAGVMKTVSPNDTGNASTNADDTTVDGYSGLTGEQVAQDMMPAWTDGTYILPIAQNNSNWETTLRVANMSEDGGPTNVTATFYGSGGQGFAGVSHVENLQLEAGEVTSVDIADHLPDEWVGSVYFTSSADIAVVADRANSSDNMLINTTSRPEHFAADDHFGALIFKEYNYWNTGISVANADDDDTNHVNIYYVGPTNNIVGQDTLTIPPRGMEFIYTPGTQDLGLFDGFVGSVIIEGDHELIANIDQVKYFGDDPDVGQAMSYVTEGPHVADGGEALAAPLVQKGNPNTGNGDTSGIQLFNIDPDDDADVDIIIYGANGLPVAPTVENNDADPIEVTIPAHGNYTLYTHGQSELSSGFQGSVMVYNEDGFGEVVGVTNNVNYEVDGDGSVAFPMVRDPLFFEFIDVMGINGATES